MVSTMLATVAARVGVDRSTFDAMDSHRRSSRPQSITTAYSETPDGQLIVGVCFQTDYDATQEYGIAELREALTGPDKRRFQMLPEATSHVTVFEDRTGFALHVRPTPVRSARWGDPITGPPYGLTEYAGVERRIEWFADDDRFALKHTKMQDLRVQARAAGIAPLPRRKDDLVAALVETMPPQSHWPAWFAHGNVLVMRADAGLTCDVLAELADAAVAGRLGVGSASGPFATGVFFYDTADETPALVAKREADFDWYDEQMAALAPVRATLESRGYRFYALGRPNLQADGVVRYWLNGSGSPQPYGWYSLDELLAEKFVRSGD